MTQYFQMLKKRSNYCSLIDGMTHIGPVGSGSQQMYGKHFSVSSLRGYYNSL